VKPAVRPRFLGCECAKRWAPATRTPGALSCSHSRSHSVVAAIAALAIGCLAAALPQLVRAAPVAPDAALTQLLINTDLHSSPPPYRNSDFYPYTDAVDGRADIYGEVVWRGPSGDAPARGLQVFLIDADAYTVYFAALASAAALIDKDAVASLDSGASIALSSAIADRNGIFVFPDKAPGTYVLFAVLHETIGVASPAEQVQRGFDGRGNGADVVVPSIEIPHFRVESSRYLYGYRLQSGQGPWNLGYVRANQVLVDGRQVWPVPAAPQPARSPR
jgi:hypothetical protein